jgi:hypothetical protein
MSGGRGSTTGDPASYDNIRTKFQGNFTKILQKSKLE